MTGHKALSTELGVSKWEMGLFLYGYFICWTGRPNKEVIHKRTKKWGQILYALWKAFFKHTLTRSHSHTFPLVSLFTRSYSSLSLYLSLLYSLLPSDSKSWLCSRSLSAQRKDANCLPESLAKNPPPPLSALDGRWGDMKGKRCIPRQASAQTELWRCALV